MACYSATDPDLMASDFGLAVMGYVVHDHGIALDHGYFLYHEILTLYGRASANVALYHHVPRIYVEMTVDLVIARVFFVHGHDFGIVIYDHVLWVDLEI